MTWRPSRCVSGAASRIGCRASKSDWILASCPPVPASVTMAAEMAPYATLNAMKFATLTPPVPANQ